MKTTSVPIIVTELLSAAWDQKIGPVGYRFGVQKTYRVDGFCVSLRDAAQTISVFFKTIPCLGSVVCAVRTQYETGFWMELYIRTPDNILVMFLLQDISANPLGSESYHEVDRAVLSHLQGISDGDVMHLVSWL
jgi:hypothetical protein